MNNIDVLLISGRVVGDVGSIQRNYTQTERRQSGRATDGTSAFRSSTSKRPFTVLKTLVVIWFYFKKILSLTIRERKKC